MRLTVPVGFRTSRSPGRELAVADRDFNRKVIEEFRANGGKVGGWFEGAPLLLLHHTGARSGTERVNPLAYQQVGDSLAIFASAAGRPRHPDWYYNLVAHPDAVVEVGTRTVKVRARVADPDERAPIYARQKKISPNFADYEKTAAPREIPVVVLDPVA
jgi:deazaflavin-dependent oxidoreductase (nitroreductase family)